MVRWLYVNLMKEVSFVTYFLRQNFGDSELYHGLLVCEGKICLFQYQALPELYDALRKILFTGSDTTHSGISKPCY